jgi:CRP/FNR family transcriptional regulator
VNFTAPPRQLRGIALPGLKPLTSLPCDQCVGRSLNLCKPLDEARLRRLLALGGIRHWKRRETLFRAGDPMGAFFKIRKGIVAVSRALDDGRRQIVAVRAPGDCVGYLDMLVLGQLKSTERVAHFLCEIDMLYRQRHIGGTPLVLHMSRGEIGDYLGLTIETVSRSMGKLKKRGLIGLVGADGVVVLEDAKLREVGKVAADPVSSDVAF